MTDYLYSTHPIAKPMTGGYVLETFAIGGVFKMVGTFGLPLEQVLSYLKDRDYTVDWMDYINDALKDGAKLSNVKSRILAAVGDVYGAAYRDQVQLRLDMAIF